MMRAEGLGRVGREAGLAATALPVERVGLRVVAPAAEGRVAARVLAAVVVVLVSAAFRAAVLIAPPLGSQGPGPELAQDPQDGGTRAVDP